MPGRPPKPTALKELAGNPGKRTINKSEPKPRATGRPPAPPRHMSKDGKKEWRRVAKELHGLGLLTKIDQTALAAYCECFVTWVEASAKCRDMGMIVKSPNGHPIQNPYFSIASQAEKRMRAWLTEFGMTPSSRARVQATPEEEADPYEVFRGQKWVVANAE